MSVIKPRIDDLLEKTDNNRFLLASLASKRACDINSMLRGQHSRIFGPVQRHRGHRNACGHLHSGKQSI